MQIPLCMWCLQVRGEQYTNYWVFPYKSKDQMLWMYQTFEPRMENTLRRMPRNQRNVFVLARGEFVDHAARWFLGALRIFVHSCIRAFQSEVPWTQLVDVDSSMNIEPFGFYETCKTKRRCFWSVTKRESGLDSLHFHHIQDRLMRILCRFFNSGLSEGRTFYDRTWEAVHVWDEMNQWCSKPEHFLSPHLV